ncbi:MAG: SDR family NAD(P)-dependent oxidoreductase [Clostridium fessum]
MVKHTVETLGDIYALVNMCPGPKPGPFVSFDDAAWEGAFEMCLLSYVRTIRAVLPSMKRLGGGRIVNSTSSSVKDCLDNLILSNTMRMGVVGMSKTLASRGRQRQYLSQCHWTRSYRHREELRI